MPIDDEKLQRFLVSIADGFRMYGEELVKAQTSIAVLRRALAQTDDDPAKAEEGLRRLETTAQADALKGLKTPVTDAILDLLKAGKKPDDFDS